MGRSWESSVFTDLGTMEQSYLPLADFFPSEQSCWCPAIVHKKLELGHLIGDRRGTGIFQEGITF